MIFSFFTNPKLTEVFYQRHEFKVTKRYGQEDDNSKVLFEGIRDLKVIKSKYVPEGICVIGTGGTKEWEKLGFKITKE